MADANTALDESQTPRPDREREQSGVSAFFGDLAEDEARGKGELESEREDEPKESNVEPKPRKVRESLRLEEEDLMDEMDQMSKSSSPVPLDDIVAPSTSSASSRKPPPADINTHAPLPSSSSSIDNAHLPALSPSQHSLNSPTVQLVETLKAQLAAVSDQRDLLNSKLVRNISRVADLEDDLEELQQQSAEQRSKLDILEHERKEHLHALDTGLLVEQSNVKAEMQKLASSLLDAQGKRDVAEEGRRTVESEVDDLAATLFQQANSMVATERLARSRAETRLATAEENLAVAEAVTREMQGAMQELHHSQSQSRSSPGPEPTTALATKPRTFLPDTLPYSELLQFVAHIRSLRPLGRPSQLSPPSLVSLMSQPFIARIIIEDHDPALRLDFAPGVSFFNKKSITQAIMDGMLEVEPVSVTRLLAQKPEGEITCALSGKTILPAQSASESLGSYLTAPMSASSITLPPPSSQSGSSTPVRPTLSSGASRFFRRPASPSLPPRQLPAASNSTTSLSSPSPSALALIYIFRIASSDPAVASQEKLHPVEQGWSLERLRATCELWRFIKTSIIAPIWAYDDETEPSPPSEKASSSTSAGSALSLTVPAGGRPALPPRKKSSGWGLGGGWSLSGLGGGSSPKLEKEQPKLPPRKEVVVPIHPPTLPPRGLGPAVIAESTTSSTPPKLPIRKVEPVGAEVVNVTAPELEGKKEDVATSSTIIGETLPSSDASSSPIAPLPPTTAEEPHATADIPSDISDAPTVPPVPSNNSVINNSSTSSADPVITSLTPSSPFATTSTIPLSSPSLSETESSDGFHTPTGNSIPLPDVAVEASTPKPDTNGVPADHPLPPSVPSTPVKPKGEPEIEEKEQETEPTSTMAPAPISTLETVEESVPLVVEVEAEPSIVPAPDSIAISSGQTSLDITRPSTPTLASGAAPPPPLPKRAAARRAVPLPPGASSRPSSISSVADLQPNSPITYSSLASDPTNASDLPAAPASALPPSLNTTDVLSSASTDSPIEITPSSPYKANVDIDSQTAIPPPLPSRTHQPAVSSSSADPSALPSYPTSTSTKDAYPEDIKPPLPSRNELITESIPSKSESSQLGLEAEASKEKKEGWEEKAWRELARLRVELAWARLGAEKGDA